MLPTVAAVVLREHYRAIGSINRFDIVNEFDLSIPRLLVLCLD